MNQNEVNISLQILFLNDLLQTEAIDKNTYDRAIRTINEQRKTTT